MNAGVVYALQKACPEEIFQQDLHISTITALQNCNNPATLQQALEEANAIKYKARPYLRISRFPAKP